MSERTEWEEGGGESEKEQVEGGHSETIFQLQPSDTRQLYSRGKKSAVTIAVSIC